MAPIRVGGIALVLYDFWMWCSDCKVFMELGNYDFEGGHFAGPFLPMDNVRTGSDWALRMFLEQHTGHRIGLEMDVDLRLDDCPIKSDWKHVQPLTEYCMIFRELETFVEAMMFPSAFKNILIVVDVYGWAWDIASKELLRHWTEVEGTIISIRDFFKNKVDPRKYDVTLVYPWGSKQLMDKMDPRKTVVCVAGGEQVQLEAALKYNCSKFKFFGACNETLKEVLEDWFPRRTVVLLNHGVETELFKPHPVQKDGFIIGWAGSTTRDIKRFPKAQEIAKEAGVALNVAGFNEEDNRRSHDEMPFFYGGCHVFLVTSEVEAHPLVAYEAMSCGVPVIATKVGDLPDNIVDGYNGFLLDVDAPVSDFVDRITLLRESPGLRKKMGVRARHMILQKWTWDKVVAQYRGLGQTLNE